MVTGLARRRFLAVCLAGAAAALGIPGVATAASPPGVLEQLAGAAGCVIDNRRGGDPSCDNTGRALNTPNSVTVSPDGTSAYVASASFFSAPGHSVAVFDRDTTTGALTQKAGTAGCIVDGPSADVAGCDNAGRALNGAASVTVSPDGTSAYVASGGSSAVVVFDRDTTTGALTQKAGTAGCIVDDPSADVAGCDNAYNAGRALNGANSVTVSPDGKSAYVSSIISGAVAVFRRDLVPVCLPATRIVPHNQTAAVDLACTDANGDAITLSLVGAPANGTVGAVNQAAGQAPYTPNAGYAGADSFTYKATANGADSDAATVSLQVLAGSPPVCASQARTAGQDTTATLALSCAAGGDPFTYSTVTGPAHGSLGAIAQSTGLVDYTPSAGYSGDDSFTYRATSAFGASSPATSALEVLPTQQGPTGPQEPAGAQGPPAFKLVVALFQANLKSVAGKWVKLRYVSTLDADVHLDVLRGKKVVARVDGKTRVGANTIAWNGRNGRKAATPGLYKLRLTAINGDQTATMTASLRVTKPKRKR